MTQLPEYTNVSVALSEVLAELGLNEVILNERRRTFNVNETMPNLLLGRNRGNKVIYMLGSQIEGTTTPGLKSDLDKLCIYKDKNVITKCKDWKPGVYNLLMVKEDTLPGYRMLQILRPNVPVPETEIIQEHCFRNRKGEILLKNTESMCFGSMFQKKHGPVFSNQVGNVRLPSDTVFAYSYTPQLPVVQHWLSRLHRRWPSEGTKRYIASSPCFLVPVGRRGSAYETLEWRISTSLAERFLMFSLNVTQLQVYVLMKMLLKTSINYNVPEESHISSFMCKTVVLHCVQNTDPNAWQSHMLIHFLLFSLFTLYACVVNENCPHFIIRSNNLMAGRFTQRTKYQLQQNLRWLFYDIISHGMLSLYIDDIASRLMLKFSQFMFDIRHCACDEELLMICFDLRRFCAANTLIYVYEMLWLLLKDRLSRLQLLFLLKNLEVQHVYMDGNMIERSACRLLRPYFYTAYSSLLASENIQNSGIISPLTVVSFSPGQNSDVASSRLKLASAFFCAGDMERAEITLRGLESRYYTNVCTPVCPWTELTWLREPTRLEVLTLASDESEIPNIISACVFFTRYEKNCIPKELQYEMYRSTHQELLHRSKLFDIWMDFAEVDPLPYLHFLCYKVYGRLGRHTDQKRALFKFMWEIETNLNLGHRETALNLLGQCMEQMNLWNEALHCYRLSLNFRPRNNAANFHVCRLLCMRYRQCHA